MKFANLKYSVPLALLLLAAPTWLGARAEEGGEEAEAEDEVTATHILTDLPEEADGVSTTYVFPDNSALVLTSGQTVEILCGLHNQGDVPLNVTQVAGSLNSPMDFGVYIQNWTSPVYNTILAPETQGTFGITIKPHLHLQPRDFVVAMSIFYESDDELFSSTCYNGTVYIVEPAGFFDVETFFMYFFIVSVVGLAAFAGFKALQSAGVVKKKSKARKVETGTRSIPVGDENEWLKGTVADAATSAKKRVTRKK
jgi:hypothetical protein